jgi:hypothetical protein
LITQRRGDHEEKIFIKLTVHVSFSARFVALVASGAASEMKAVILTHDCDFLEMADDFDHCGIIFSHSKNVSIGQCIRGVELMQSVLTDKEMKNHIEFL